MTAAKIGGQGWRNWLYDNQWHVMPVDDTYEHQFSERCPCRPTIERKDVDGADLVVHNSWDKREETESDA